MESDPDCTVLACSNAGNVSLLKLDAPGERWQLCDESESETDDIISTFCIHPTKMEIVVATNSFLLRHWRISDHCCLRSIKAGKMPILSLDFHSTGVLVATGSADRAVKVWDIIRGYCTHNFSVHKTSVQIVKFHPHSEREELLSSSDDGIVSIHNLKTSECLAIFSEHVSVATALTFGFHGRLLASSSGDKVVNFYCMGTYKHIKTKAIMDELKGALFLGSQLSSIVSKSKMDGDCNKRILITAGSKGVIQLFRVTFDEKRPGDILCEALDEIRAFDYKSPHINPSAFDSTLRKYESITSLHYLKLKGQVMLVTEDYNFLFFNVDSKRGSLTREEKHLIGRNDDILDLSIVPQRCRGSQELSNSSCDTGTIAVVTNSPQIKLLDINDSFQCIALNGHTDIVLALDVSPDGCVFFILICHFVYPFLHQSKPYYRRSHTYIRSN